MNNFRNPYVDHDSFHGETYDYHRNPTNPHGVHFSLNNQGGFEQKETQKSEKTNQYDKTIKQSININQQIEKISDSKPILFSPPLVDSIQKPLNEDSIDELALNIAQSKNSENEKKDKKEVVSSLIKEFSQMLDDTSSIHEGDPTLHEGKFEYDTLLNSDESTSISENKIGDEYTNDTDNENVTENHVHTKRDNSEMLFDEFHSMLDDHNDYLISDGENIESLNENNDTIEGTFFAMLSDIDELQEENHESSFTNLQEKKSDKIEDLTKVEEFVQSNDSDLLVLENNSISKYEHNLLEEDQSEIKENTTSLYEDIYNELTGNSAFTHENNNNQKENNIDSKLDSSQRKKYFQTQEKEDKDTCEDELHLCHKKTPFKKEKKRKCCINKNNPYTVARFKKIDCESFFQKNAHCIDLFEKKKKTTVKMQVLLTRLETDIDIVETIDLLMPLENILKIEWSIQSFDCKVVLPSKTVFLTGEFIAEIEFSNKGLENKIQSLKVPIPWSKTTNVNWLTVPDISHSSQNEFMFQSQHEHDSSYHYESYQKFAEPIHIQLNQINFVWHQELNSKDKHLQLNGVAQLYIHFMQEQFIELDCYSK